MRRVRAYIEPGRLTLHHSDIVRIEKKKKKSNEEAVVEERWRRQTKKIALVRLLSILQFMYTKKLAMATPKLSPIYTHTRVVACVSSLLSENDHYKYKIKNICRNKWNERQQLSDVHCERATFFRVCVCVSNSSLQIRPTEMLLVFGLHQNEKFRNWTKISFHF